MVNEVGLSNSINLLHYFPKIGWRTALSNLSQTVTWQDGAGRSADLHRDDKRRIAATRTSGRVLWKREKRCRIEPAIFIRGQDESSGGASASCPAWFAGSFSC